MITVTPMATLMSDRQAVSQIRLMNWVSPSFPLGAFTYSHGLEAAVANGVVSSSKDLFEWLQTLVKYGSGRSDTVLCSLAYQTAIEGTSLDDLAELAEALAPTRERRKESTDQGAAFSKGVKAWLSHSRLDPDDKLPFPIALGKEAAIHKINPLYLLTGYLNAFVSNLIQVSIRLGIMGQTDGLSVLSKLEPAILDTAENALSATECDIGSASFLSDLMSMQHETLSTRIFIS